MELDPWYERLNEAIDRDERSLRAISIAAGLGPNFISQMRHDRKSPSVENVIKLAAELNVSLSWIFLGAEMSAEDEALLSFAQQIPAEQKQKLIALLGSFASLR